MIIDPPLPLRELLARFGHADSIRDPDGVMDAKIVQADFSITEGGRVFAVCGGPVLMTFYRQSEFCVGVGLVLDDKDGEQWESDNRARTGQPHADAQSGPRPSAFLILKPFAR